MPGPTSKHDDCLSIGQPGSRLAVALVHGPRGCFAVSTADRRYVFCVSASEACYAHRELSAKQIAQEWVIALVRAKARYATAQAGDSEAACTLDAQSAT